MTATSVQASVSGALHMRARAHVRTALSPRRASRIDVLRSQAPMALRSTIARGPEPWAPYDVEPARVCLAASGAGPVGGDQLGLEVHVGAGTTLLLSEASATLLLPGVHGEASVLTVDVRVDEGATLVWLPEPVIAARGCRHRTQVRVDLAVDARLMMREELLLGRRGEGAGSVELDVRVRRGGLPLLSQTLSLGGDLAATPAVVGEHRAAGTVLVVDPALPTTESTGLEGDGVLMPLAAGGAVLAQGLAADSLQLRRQLDTALRLLGPPWEPTVRHSRVPPSHEEAP